MLVDGPDGALWVETAGSGKPVTVFAHGITGSMLETAPLATAAPGTRVLFDFRGHGRSEAVPTEAGYDHLAMRRDLQVVADRFEATRAVGLSMGAGAILSTLEDDPNRFERIVLIAPASIDVPNEGSGGLLVEQANRLEQEGLEATLAWSLQDNELVRRRPYWRELMRERTMAMNRDGIPRALRGYVRGPAPVTDASALKAVRVPVLLIAHQQDPMHDVAIARRLAGLFPNATLRVWPEALAEWDDIQAFAALIGAFL